MQSVSIKIPSALLVMLFAYVIYIRVPYAHAVISLLSNHTVILRFRS